MTFSFQVRFKFDYEQYSAHRAELFILCCDIAHNMLVCTLPPTPHNPEENK